MLGDDYMLSKEEVLKVIYNLVGNIYPVGETNSDNDAYERQDVAELLIDAYLDDMINIARGKNRAEYSISRAGKRAYEYLLNVQEWLCRCLESIDKE